MPRLEAANRWDLEVDQASWKGVAEQGTVSGCVRAKGSSKTSELEVATASRGELDISGVNIGSGSEAWWWRLGFQCFDHWRVPRDPLHNRYCCSAVAAKTSAIGQNTTGTYI